MNLQFISFQDAEYELRRNYRKTKIKLKKFFFHVDTIIFFE